MSIIVNIHGIQQAEALTFSGESFAVVRIKAEGSECSLFLDNAEAAQSVADAINKAVGNDDA